MKKIFFSLISGSLIFLLTGCFVSELGSMSGRERIEYLKSIKPYGAHWVKEGMTRESRIVDWLECGGGENLSDGYEHKSGITNKEYFDGLNSRRNQIRNCMDSKGYNWIEQCDTRCL
jgi:hypothetical protein